MNDTGIDNKKILEMYLPMVEFISGILGPQTEVVLHDLSMSESSIISIKNGNLSGRSLGSALEDHTIKAEHRKIFKNEDYRLNYGLILNNRVFRSSTYFIKNFDSEIIGYLCINTDSEAFLRLKEFLDYFCSFAYSDKNQAILQPKEIDKKLENSTRDLIDKEIEYALKNYDVKPERMTKKEKMQIVKYLEINNIFILKGSVAEVASVLKISEPTLYRYIKEIKNK